MTTAQHLPAFRPPPALPEFLGGAILTGLVHDGEALVLAREVGEALGYHSAGKGFVDAITRSWSTEMHEGKHYRVLNSADEVVVIGKGVDSTPLSNRGSMCLTEKGVWRAIMLGRTEPCIQARDWVEDDLLPWYREQRRLHAAGVPTARPGATPRPSTPLDLTRRRLTLREAREGRLRRAQELKAMKAARALDVATEEEERAMLRRHLRELAQEQPVTVHEDSRRHPRQLTGPSGESLPHVPEGAVMLPEEAAIVSHAWLSPRQIAQRIGVLGTEAQQERRVSLAISGVGLKRFGDKDGLRHHETLAKRALRNRRAGEAVQADEDGIPLTVWSSVYDPDRVPPLLRDWLRREHPHWLPPKRANLSAAPVDPEGPAA